MSLLASVERKIHEAKQELQSIRDKRQQDRAQRHQLQETLCVKSANLASELDKGKKDMPLYAYANIMSKIRGQSNTVESSYVVSLEAQVCRALHLWGSLTKQKEIITACNDDIARSVQRELVRVTDEKTMLEISLVNELIVADSRKQTMQEDLKKKLASQQEELLKLREWSTLALTRDIVTIQEEDSVSEESDCDSLIPTSEDSDAQPRSSKVTTSKIDVVSTTKSVRVDEPKPSDLVSGLGYDNTPYPKVSDEKVAPGLSTEQGFETENEDCVAESHASSSSGALKVSMGEHFTTLLADDKEDKREGIVPHDESKLPSATIGDAELNINCSLDKISLGLRCGDVETEENISDSENVKPESSLGFNSRTSTTEFFYKTTLADKTILLGFTTEDADEAEKKQLDPKSYDATTKSSASSPTDDSDSHHDAVTSMSQMIRSSNAAVMARVK